VGIRYLGRDGTDHILEMTTWEGPIRADQQRHHVTEILRAPRDQRGIARHPRHITASRVDDNPECCAVAACISPSVRGYRDVARRFRFGKRTGNSEGVEG